MNKDKRTIKKSLSENNISNDNTIITCIPNRIYTVKEIFKMIDFYYHPYCPVCKKKNKSGTDYMALDMMFCSEFCRELICKTINYKTILDRKYVYKVYHK